MRRAMNAAYGASGRYVGGSGSVPNNGGTDKGNNPNRRGNGVVLSPTVLFLCGLVVAEYLSLVLLRRTFKHAHGG